MIVLEDTNGYWKISVWKDNMPVSYKGEKGFSDRFLAGKADWYAGTLCIEAKLNPRHISNYAMICMRYTPKDIAETELIIYSDEEQIFFESTVLPFKKRIHVGLLEEFEEAIKDYFYKGMNGNLPSGTIEVLYGGYDEVGSSSVSIKKTLELLVFLFQHIEKMSDDRLKEELLCLI